MPTAREFLQVIAWNVYIGNRAVAVRKALVAMIARYTPDVFVLMEASGLYGDLEGLGYKVVQMKPVPLKRGNQPAQANIAILVGPDFQIKKRFAQYMREFWIGPKHGWPQDPRVYRWVKIKRKDVFWARTWKIGGAHIPFGVEARQESVSRLRRKLKRTLPGRPVILNLDANMSLREFQERVADPAGADASGHVIDLEAHLNCELVHDENIGKGISDHPAINRKYAAKRRAA